MDEEQQVMVALRAEAGAVRPPIDELVHGARELGLRRRRTVRTRAMAGAAIGAVAVAGAGLWLGPWTTTTSHRANPPATGVPQGNSCPLRTDPLPSWAATGFSDPTASGVPHAIGARGLIAAVTFGKLHYPEAKDVFNKVLWVSKVPQLTEPLVIDAHLMGTGETVRRTLPTGPGPSYLELPAAGCWELSLTWNGGTAHDSLVLPFLPPG